LKVGKGTRRKGNWLAADGNTEKSKRQIGRGANREVPLEDVVRGKER